MAEALAIGHLSQIPMGEGRTFELSGLRVAVFHTRAGQVFATQAHCPHRGGPLADGLTDDISVVCPLHDRIYDLRTGTGLGTPCAISVYPVRIGADGTIQLVPQPSEAITAAN
ncbi:Rieske (2Fe-2S) protein [Rhodopila sp.]|uniref:Rieske (2Fe-2S) protein n=1 Tax=Rhodopila sp. TaxID=2480087 RepID=UPI003D1280B1